jgi:hypothetical protein
VSSESETGRKPGVSHFFSFFPSFAIVIAFIATGLIGCRDNSPPVAQVLPPDIGQDTYRREVDYPKPLPAGPRTTVTTPRSGELEPPPESAPAMTGMPEAQSFVDVYRRVNSPRIIVYVNPGLSGQLLPARDPRSGQPIASTDGPAKATDTDNSGIDYAAIDTALADSMGCGGKVNIVPSATVRTRLNPEQLTQLHNGRPDALAGLDGLVQGHVLIQVQLRGDGTNLNAYAEAINVRGAGLLARASAPVDRAQPAAAANALARDLMAGLAKTWAQPVPAPAESAAPAKDATGSADPVVEKPTVPVSAERPLSGNKLPPPLPPPPPINQ